MEVITDDGRLVELTTPKVCIVLALLLLRSNEVVGVDSLVQELWGANPPRSALTTLQTYVYHGRRIFDREGLGSTSRPLLVTRPPGYLMQVAEGEVDVAEFEWLAKQGRVMLNEGRPQDAVHRLRQALRLWRGPALANIPGGDILKGHATHLEECKIRIIELCIEGEQRLGHHRELVSELRALVAAYPLNEWFHGQLIQALNYCGRRAEALQVYQNLQRILDDELGLKPTPEIQRLQYELLNAGYDS
jgi:DNA-binding SARP family transcriptional activator